MGRKKAIVYPRGLRKLKIMGEQIRMARLRRHMTEDEMAERAMISRSTVYKIENGSPSVSIGHITAVLTVLGMQDDILKLAGNDTLGRSIQDIEMKQPRRAPKRNTETTAQEKG